MKQSKLDSLEIVMKQSKLDSLEIGIKQRKLDSMSLDELFMLHARLTATLEARITAEKERLRDQLKKIGSSKAWDHDI